ncbi:unnamed protein product [Somion occarium]|uniref:Uncharacterized protein n=1 Tax=Somion occarium TaxID=3059160 RepID=A0ABP1CRP3_9APHY
MEPTTGLFIGSGLPFFSLPTMRKVTWVSPACHFISDIRTASGISNFWVRANEVSQNVRSLCLESALKDIPPAYPATPNVSIDESVWKVNEWGLLERRSLAGKPIPRSPLPSPSESKLSGKPSIPSAHDFLLFAAIDYHVFREWTVHIVRKKQRVFSTEGSGHHCVFDVSSEEDAMPIVAAQIVHRPTSQSNLRPFSEFKGTSEDDLSPYTLEIDRFWKSDAPVCHIDFHSYAPREHSTKASLRELAGAYFRVVQYLKQDKYRCMVGEVAQISVGQSLWIAILGGALLDKGRTSFQNLPGRRILKSVSADEAYQDRVEAVLKEIEPCVNKQVFDDMVFSGGVSRAPAMPLLVTGLVGQILVCYFLAVDTSAGVWTSVALSNSLFAGKLTDLHTLYFGKTHDTAEPGMKMRLPSNPSQLMVIATLDRSAPSERKLRPGFLLNLLGLIGATLGTVFQNQTRDALGFAPFEPCRPWVVYTAAGISLSAASLVLLMLFNQQRRSRDWFNQSEFPTRIAVYSTLTTALGISVLTIVFRLRGLTRFWPILDVLTWISGLPLGAIENGRMISIDRNMLHLLLTLRWLMGAMASAMGSSE